MMLKLHVNDIMLEDSLFLQIVELERKCIASQLEGILKSSGIIRGLQE